MVELILSLPTAVLVVSAAACVGARRSILTQQGIVLVAMTCVLVIAAFLLVIVARSGPLSLAVGSWPAPIGIELHADLTAAIMVAIAALIGVTIAIYAIADVPRAYQERGFWPVLVLLVMGVVGSFLTADLFNLFVWFELFLVASFVMLALGTTRAQLRATHVYLILNLLASTLFLVGIGLVYATVRTLDMREIAARMADLSASQPGTVLAIHAMLMVAFGIKAAVFPLMFWLPASYHTPPPVVSALFAALLTKVGVYAMLRVGAGLFPEDVAMHHALAGVAIATMIVGVLGALAQKHMRRLLAFHIVSQIGYMVAGIALIEGTLEAQRFAMAATLFFVIHNILAKTTLFLVAGIVRHLRGTEELARLGGVARSHPLLAALFLIAALALAGIPPFSGFWGKLAIIAAGLESGRVFVVAAATVVSLLTLTSMLKLWIAVFLGSAADPTDVRTTSPRTITVMYGATAGLALAILVLSVVPEPLFALALGAAEQLLPATPTSTWTGGTP
jgi:multicomponent Na+:H+ antiporter subunit D